VPGPLSFSFQLYALELHATVAVSDGGTSESGHWRIGQKPQLESCNGLTVPTWTYSRVTVQVELVIGTCPVSALIVQVKGVRPELAITPFLDNFRVANDPDPALFHYSSRSTNGIL
jgi:hypothetical protein